MDYESMPRAELIAELKAWESKSDDLFNQKHKKRIAELEQKYKNFDSKIREKYKEELDKQTSIFESLDALVGDERYQKIKQLELSYSTDCFFSHLDIGVKNFFFREKNRALLNDKFNKMISAYNDFNKLADKIKGE
jgi:hypothetical protein